MTAWSVRFVVRHALPVIFARVALWVTMDAVVSSVARRAVWRISAINVLEIAQKGAETDTITMTITALNVRRDVKVVLMKARVQRVKKASGVTNAKTFVQQNAENAQKMENAVRVRLYAFLIYCT